MIKTFTNYSIRKGTREAGCARLCSRLSLVIGALHENVAARIVGKASPLGSIPYAPPIFCFKQLYPCLASITYLASPHLSCACRRTSPSHLARLRRARLHRHIVMPRVSVSPVSVLVYTRPSPYRPSTPAHRGAAGLHFTSQASVSLVYTHTHTSWCHASPCQKGVRRERSHVMDMSL
jgi:hypothetical protein